LNSVIDAIFENYQYIEIVFSETRKSFVKDTKNTSDIRELSVKEFLESFLPKTYCVKKGPIHSLNSPLSNEIDCVILASNHPELITPKREVIIAEGVFAAVEVKPDISTLTVTSEFHRGLNQIKSVKNIDRTLPILFTERDVPEEFHKIPCIIFSKKSRKAFDTIAYMKKQVVEGKLLSKELPDIVVTLDNGIIFHSLHIEKTLFSNWVCQQSKVPYGEKYIHLETNKEETLAMFILILLCFKQPEPEISKNILIEYIKSGIKSIRFHIYEP
jgi:hypothetical protein